MREPRGPQVLPGTYTVRLSFAGQSDSTTVNVRFDPRLNVPEEKLMAREALLQQVMQYTELATEAADRLRDAKKTITEVSERLKEREGEAVAQVKKQGKALQDSIKALLELINGKEVQGIRRDPNVVNSKIGMASRYLQSSWDSYGEPARLLVQQAYESLQAAVAEVNAFFKTDWAAYRKAVEGLDISFFQEYEPLTAPAPNN